MKLCGNCKYKALSTTEPPCVGCIDKSGGIIDARPNWKRVPNKPKSKVGDGGCSDCLHGDLKLSDPPCEECEIDEPHYTNWEPQYKKQLTGVWIDEGSEPMLAHEIQPAIEEADALTNAFEYLNEELFDNELPMVKLSLTRNPRVKKGHFAENAWVDEAGVEWHEIAINAQWYAEVQDWRLAMTTMVHEMGHLEQCARGNAGRESYHNRQYVDRMRAMGVDSLDMEGNRVSSGDRVSSSLIVGGKLEGVLLVMPEEYIFPYLPKLMPDDPPQEPRTAGPAPEPKKRGVKTKYTCAKCGLNMWGKPESRIACLDCNREMMATV